MKPAEQEARGLDVSVVIMFSVLLWMVLIPMALLVWQPGKGNRGFYGALVLAGIVTGAMVALMVAPSAIQYTRGAFDRLLIKKQSTNLPGNHGKSSACGKIFFLIVPSRSRDHLIGDLEEEHNERVASGYGYFRVRLWRWGQVISIIRHYSWQRIKNTFGVEAISRLLRR